MAPERAAARPRFAYIPFGAGPRICIGASLSMTEAILILASVARCWRLRLMDSPPVEPVGLITLRPRYPMMMELDKRPNAAGPYASTAIAPSRSADQCTPRCCERPA